MKKPPFEKSRGKKRGPERSVDIELSSPARARKKRTIPIWYRSFFKRETGIEPATPSLARRCSTAEPLAHVLQTSYNILWRALNVNRKSVHLFEQLHIQFAKYSNDRSSATREMLSAAVSSAAIRRIFAPQRSRTGKPVRYSAPHLRSHR